MSINRQKRRRQVKLRSYRKLNQMLFVFGLSGLALGSGLVFFFMLQRRWFLVGVGVIYILVAMFLLGLRGVLAYLGELNKRRRADHHAEREASV